MRQQQRKSLWWIIPLSLELPALVITWACLAYMIYVPSVCTYPCNPSEIQNNFFFYTAISFFAVPLLSVLVFPVGLILAFLVMAEVSYVSGWKMPILKVVSAKKLWLVVLVLNVVSWLMVLVAMLSWFAAGALLAFIYAPVIGLLGGVSAGIIAIYKKVLNSKSVAS